MIRRFTVIALLALVPLAIGCGDDDGGSGAGGSPGTGATGGPGTGAVPGTGATGGQPTSVDGSAACGPNQSCSFSCTAGSCDHDCDGQNSVCTSTCVGGSCDQDCEAGATCTMSCGGGDCELDCDSAAVACSFSCVDDTCDIEECGDNCTCTGPSC